MFIISTADDLGLHPAVRRAAKRLAGRGTITSVSLLANGPDAETCFALQGVGVGVQLNVLQGRPLSRQERVSTMLRHDGCFLGDYKAMFKRFLDGKVQLAQIEAEWAAQIEFVLDHSVQPTHLTSHQGMHAWPGLMNIASRLAKRYGIGWVRLPRQCETVLSGALEDRSDFLNVCAMLRKMSASVRIPDMVWGNGQERGDGQPMSFLRDCTTEKHEVVEIVSRPGDPADDDTAVADAFFPGPTRRQWGLALAAMESRTWREVWEQLGATLVHYGNLDGDLDRPEHE